MSFYKQNPTKPNRLRIWGYLRPEATIVELNLVESVLEDVTIGGQSKETGSDAAAKQNSHFDFYNEESEDEETQGKSHNLWD